MCITGMVIIIRGGVGASVGCMGMEFPRKKPTNCTGMQPEVRNGEGYLPRGVVFLLIYYLNLLHKH